MTLSGILGIFSWLHLKMPKGRAKHLCTEGKSQDLNCKEMGFVIAKNTIQKCPCARRMAILERFMKEVCWVAWVLQHFNWLTFPSKGIQQTMWGHHTCSWQRCKHVLGRHTYDSALLLKTPSYCEIRFSFIEIKLSLLMRLYMYMYLLL